MGVLTGLRPAHELPVSTFSVSAWDMGVGLTFALWNERLLMLREDPHSCWSPHYELRQPDNWELVHRLAAMEAAEECWHRREAAAIEVEEDLAYVTFLAESKHNRDFF